MSTVTGCSLCILHDLTAALSLAHVSEGGRAYFDRQMVGTCGHPDRRTDLREGGTEQHGTKAEWVGNGGGKGAL